MRSRVFRSRSFFVVKRNKMKIQVHIIKQKNKMGCGAAAMSMVYKYFGKDIAEKEIIKETGGLTKWGSFTTDHALMARKLGFKVICHSYNLEYFEPSYTKLSRADFIRKTKSLIGKEKRAYNKRELKSILKVLKSDIDFKMVIPSLNIMRKFLDKKLPVCVAVNSAVLFEKKRDLRLGHFIVLTGYEKDKFYYGGAIPRRSVVGDRAAETNLPAGIPRPSAGGVVYYNDPDSGTNKTISADKLIFALSNNIFGSSAYLLVTKK